MEKIETKAYILLRKVFRYLCVIRDMKMPITGLSLWFASSPAWVITFIPFIYQYGVVTNLLIDLTAFDPCLGVLGAHVHRISVQLSPHLQNLYPNLWCFWVLTMGIHPKKWWLKSPQSKRKTLKTTPVLHLPWHLYLAMGFHAPPRSSVLPPRPRIFSVSVIYRAVEATEALILVWWPGGAPNFNG